MKTFILTILLILFAAQSKSQVLATFADTANYLMNLEKKKATYIGKPFSVLYDSLKVKPVLVGPDYTDIDPNDKVNFAKELRFNFNFQLEFGKKHLFVITYNAPPAYSVIYPKFYPKETRASVAEIVNIYKPLIVKDIVVKDYYADPDWMPALKEYTSIEANAAITEQQKNLVRDQLNYYDQPFSVLWSHLSVKPKTVSGVSAPGDASKESATHFFYSTPDQLSVTEFIITWATPIPKTETQHNQLSLVRDFTDPKEYAIYANKIVQFMKVLPDPNRGWIVVSCVYKKVLVDGLYQWRYEITKKYCNGGTLGSETQVSYSTTSVPVQNCVGGDALVPLSTPAK